MDAQQSPQLFAWPAPPDTPLYVTIERAAKIAGVSRETMEAWANDQINPIPHMVMGRRKKLIRTGAIPEYAKGKEYVG